MMNSSRFKWLLIGFILLIFIWQAVSFLFKSSLVFPAPADVFEEIIELIKSGKLFIQLLQTFYKAFLGLFLALLIGLITGFFVGIFRALFELLRPVLMVLRSVPVVSWLSTVILLWGIGWKGVVFIVFMTLLPVVIFNVAEGVRSVDIKLIEMAKVYNVPRPKMFKSIYAGSVLPFLLSAINISIGTMWKAAIVSEYLIGDSGLGLQIFQAKFYVDTPKVFAYTVSAIFFGLLLEIIFYNIWERFFGEKAV